MPVFAHVEAPVPSTVIKLFPPFKVPFEIFILPIVTVEPLANVNVPTPALVNLDPLPLKFPMVKIPVSTVIDLFAAIVTTPVPKLRF